MWLVEYVCSSLIFSVLITQSISQLQKHIIIKAPLNHYQFHLTACMMAVCVCMRERASVCLLDKLTECAAARAVTIRELGMAG